MVVTTTSDDDLVVATTLLGLHTAWARAASGSLFPAVGAHVAFNVGGVAGGVVYTIARAITTGELPDRPGDVGSDVD